MGLRIVRALDYGNSTQIGRHRAPRQRRARLGGTDDIPPRRDLAWLAAGRVRVHELHVDGRLRLPASNRETEHRAAWRTGARGDPSTRRHRIRGCATARLTAGRSRSGRAFGAWATSCDPATTAPRSTTRPGSSAAGRAASIRRSLDTAVTARSARQRRRRRLDSGSGSGDRLPGDSSPPLARRRAHAARRRPFAAATTAPVAWGHGGGLRHATNGVAAAHGRASSSGGGQPPRPGGSTIHARRSGKRDADAGPRTVRARIIGSRMAAATSDTEARARGPPRRRAATVRVTVTPPLGGRPGWSSAARGGTGATVRGRRPRSPRITRRATQASASKPRIRSGSSRPAGTRASSRDTDAAGSA